MATCPQCKVSSRAEPGALVVEEILEAKPLGDFSLAGATPKVVAHRPLRLRCTRCGWSILGRIENGEFLGDPLTQRLGEHE